MLDIMVRIGRNVTKSKPRHKRGARRARPLCEDRGLPAPPVHPFRPAAILFDFGDTLVDEGSQEVGGDGATVSGRLLPGADEVIRALRWRGYPLALAVDCVPGTGQRAYENVLGEHGLLDRFATIVTSDQVGVNKPDPRVFTRALGDLGLAVGAPVVMVGNRLERDVAGANRLGLTSVWLSSGPRYRKVPQHDDERPDFEIARLTELLSLFA